MIYVTYNDWKEGGEKFRRKKKKKYHCSPTLRWKAKNMGGKLPPLLCYQRIENHNEWKLQGRKRVETTVYLRRFCWGWRPRVVLRGQGWRARYPFDRPSRRTCLEQREEHLRFSEWGNFAISGPGWRPKRSPLLIIVSRISYSRRMEETGWENLIGRIIASCELDSASPLIVNPRI